MRMGISTRCQTFPDFTEDPSIVQICFGLLRVMRGRFHSFTREILMKFWEAPESISTFVVFSALPANACRVVKNWLLVPIARHSILLLHWGFLVGVRAAASDPTRFLTPTQLPRCQLFLLWQRSLFPSFPPFFLLSSNQFCSP